jgi:PAS domain S-box-containing protein
MAIKAGKPMASERAAEGFGLRKDGSVFPVEQTFSLHWTSNEQFFTMIVRDISRRKEVEKKLYESEELFRLSFENAPIGICIFDKNGAMLQANRFCEQCFGRSRDDIMRQGFPMFLHPDDRDKTTQTLRSLANIHETNGKLFVLENRYFSADGRTIYTKQHIQGYYDEAGSLSLVIVLTEDITAAQQLTLTNATILSKLKEVHSQLKEFNDLLPENKKFLSAKSLSDYGFSFMENRIASMIYHGHTNKKIAQQLCISESTVKHHITSIYTKCRVKNRIGFIDSIRTNRIAI